MSRNFAHRVPDENTKTLCLGALRHKGGNLLREFHKALVIRGEGERIPVCEHALHAHDEFQQNQTAFACETPLHQDNWVIETVADPNFGSEFDLMKLLV